MYLEGGAGLWRDEKKAVMWFRNAADQGFAPAQYSLALLYYNGLSTADYEPDYEETISWLDRAVKQKYLPSMTLLGRMYVSGEGIKKDVGRGVELWRFAAEHGFHTAQVLMGMVYHRGDLGVPRDLDMAYQWYQRAADQGDEFGKDQLRHIDIWCQKDANARLSCPEFE